MREEIRTTNEQTVATLREEIRATNAQTVERLTEVIEAARRETRVLFEEALGRIALLDEGRRNEGGKSKKK